MDIRAAHRGDEAGILTLIKALADYEKAPLAVVNTVAELGQHLFEDEICAAFVAEDQGNIVGFALWYTSYSTWKGKCLYLEDLYVLPEYRSLKLGSRLFDKVVETAKSQGVKRMDWQVLEWNQPAIDFYLRKHCVLDPEWINGRLFFD